MLLNRLDTATIVIGLDGVVVYANPACERLLGYQTAKTLEGQSLAALLAGKSGSPPRDWIDIFVRPEHGHALEPQRRLPDRHPRFGPDGSA